MRQIVCMMYYPILLHPVCTLWKHDVAIQRAGQMRHPFNMLPMLSVFSGAFILSILPVWVQKDTRVPLLTSKPIEPVQAYLSHHVFDARAGNKCLHDPEAITVDLEVVPQSPVTFSKRE